MASKAELLALFMARQMFEAYQPSNTSGEISYQELFDLLVGMARQTVGFGMGTQTVQIIDGAITIPGPGIYIVEAEPESPYHHDDLDQIISSCSSGDRVFLRAAAGSIITLRNAQNNILNPPNIPSLILEEDLWACELMLQGVTWYVIGGGGSGLYGIISGNLAHSGAHAGFFGETPIVQPDAYTLSNVTPRRTINADNTTLDEIIDLVGTIAADLKAYGLFK
jgi:sulfur transfer complex TusBCD TusB component (DsrH family)